jgi:hypothetical protein
VLDLPFGRNQKYATDLPPLANKVIGGWGLDGVTTFQNGFPINIGSGGNGVNYYGGGLRPNVVAGCKKATSGNGAARVLSGLAGTRLASPRPHRTPGATNRVSIRVFKLPASTTGTLPSSSTRHSVLIRSWDSSSGVRSSTPSTVCNSSPHPTRLAPQTSA